MRIALLWLAVWFVVASSAHAQSVPTYSLLRENEDWSFLRDTSLRQDVWDPPQVVTWPAIVTEVLHPDKVHNATRVRLTAFRPFDKPIWDITASYSESPVPQHWSWPNA